MWKFPNSMVSPMQGVFLKGKDVHLNWCDVLEPGFVFFFFNIVCSEKKTNMETLQKVAVVIPKHYGVISQHYGVIARSHDRIHLPLFLLLMDLQSPWRKRVLYCSGYWDHLCFSQAYAWWAIVPQPSQPLTFGNVIFGCPASKFPGHVKKHAVWESGNFCMQHLSRY